MGKTTTRSKWLLLLFFVLLSLLASMVMASHNESDEQITNTIQETSEEFLTESLPNTNPPVIKHTKSFEEESLEGEDSELEKVEYSNQLDKLYKNAYKLYEGEINYKPVQLINEKGHYMTTFDKEEDEMSKQTMIGLMGAIQGIKEKKYTVVSIFGPQSSGKSYLMNKAFGTDFAIKEGHMDQKTRGVWLARSNVMKDLLVIDCEGTGGAERTKQEGLERQMAERGMLFSLLVSQIVIFNIDKAHLNTEAERAILTNIVNHYMNNRKIGSPSLRMIISVRNVGHEVRLEEVKKHAIEIVDEAYKKNQKNTQESFDEIFNIEVFWFGIFIDIPNFDYRMMYKAEEHYEEDSQPNFHGRLELFKKRFSPEHSKSFLKDLAPAVDISEFPLYLHEFWEIVRKMDDVSIGGTLELFFQQSVDRITGQLTSNYKKLWADLIRKVNREDPNFERISERISDHIRLKRTESIEHLERSAPNYGDNKALQAANDRLVKTLSQIDAKLIEKLMTNLASSATNNLKGAIDELLLENTHEKEAEALDLITKTINSIQLISADKNSEVWASSLLELKRTTAEKAKEQQKTRVAEALNEGIHSMSGHKGDFVEKVKELATQIAEREGFDYEEERVKALQNDIASALSAKFDPEYRMHRVMNSFNNDYNFADHVVNERHIETISDRAKAEKDHLVKFRDHFEGRIKFRDTADAWNEEMTKAIEQAHETKKRARDIHVFKKSFSSQVKSLKTALILVSIYAFQNDPSIIFGIILFFFNIIAINGMLSEKFLSPAEWINFISNLMSFSGSVKMIAGLFKGVQSIGS